MLIYIPVELWLVTSGAELGTRDRLVGTFGVIIFVGMCVLIIHRIFESTKAKLKRKQKEKSQFEWEKNYEINQPKPVKKATRIFYLQNAVGVGLGLSIMLLLLFYTRLPEAYIIVLVGSIFFAILDVSVRKLNAKTKHLEPET